MHILSVTTTCPSPVIFAPASSSVNNSTGWMTPDLPEETLVGGFNNDDMADNTFEREVIEGSQVTNMSQYPVSQSLHQHIIIYNNLALG